MARFMDENDTYARRIGDNGAPAFVDTRDEQNTGWVRIQRSIRKHWLVGFGSLGKYSRSEAWQDLIMECRYEDGTVSNGGRRMNILAGQLVGAVSWLAQRWNWTPKEVRGFLEKLENDGMISMIRAQTESGHHKGKQSNIVTISNYSEYQLPNYHQGQAKGPLTGKSGATDGQVKGNIYKDNHLTIEPLNQREESLVASAPASEHRQLVVVEQAVEFDLEPTPGVLVPVDPAPKAKTPGEILFDEFWTVYPRKEEKKKAKELFEKIVKAKKAGQRVRAETIIAAAREYRDLKSRKPEFTKMPGTWLRAGCWDDEHGSADTKAIPSNSDQAYWDDLKAEKAAALARARGEDG